MISRIYHLIRTYFALIVVVGVFLWASLMIVVYRNRETPPGAIILRLGHWQLEASVRDGIEMMAKKYRETHPNVYIVQDAIPESVYGQWVSTQLMGNTAPDIVQVGALLPDNIWLSYYQRYFTALTRDINKPNPYNRGTALEKTTFRLTYKDDMRTAYVNEMQDFISVPLSQFGYRIFYNRDVLKKLTGLDAPPRDYRAFLDVCRTIASHTNQQGQFYIPIAGSTYHFGAWDMMMCSPLTYGVVRKADFNRDGDVGIDELYVAVKTDRLDFHYPPLAAKFQMVSELAEYFQPGYVGLSRDEAVFLFAQQRAIFMTTGTWDARSLQKQAEGQFTVGVMDFPVPAKDDPYYGPIVEGPNYEEVAVGFRFGVTRTSQHPELAFDFLRFMASQKMNEELNKFIGWIPAIVGTQIDPVLKAFEPHLEGIYNAFNTSLGGETLNKWNQVYTLFQVRQIAYDDLIKDFVPFYKQTGIKEFQEQRRDWQRGTQRNEQFLAAIRAKALTSEGGDSSAWVKYRALISSSKIMTDLGRVRLVKLLEQGADPAAIGPYEYSPAALEKIKTHIKKELAK